MFKRLVTGAIAIVLAANAVALATDVNPWLGFVAAFVLFPLAVLSIDRVPARVVTVAIVAIVIGCGATGSVAIAQADDHTNQHLVCHVDQYGEEYCDWYWND